MANLTEYMSGPSGGKPVITTEVQKPDIFGAAADFAKATISIFPSDADKAKLAKAEAEAVTNAALDEYAMGAANIMRGYVQPADVDHATNKIMKMRKAGVSTLQVSAELAKLEKMVLNKYPDQAAEIFKYANDNGLDAARFRPYYLAKENEDFERGLMNEAFKTFNTLLVSEGVDTSQYSKEQIIAAGSERQRQIAEFDWNKKVWEFNKDMAAEDRAAESHDWTMKGKQREEAEYNVVTSARVNVKSRFSPQMVELARLAQETAKVGTPEAEKAYKAAAEQVLLAVAAQQQQLHGDLPGISKESRELIDNDIKLYTDFIQSTLTGDLSVNAKRVSNFANFIAQAKEDAIKTMPAFMTSTELFGDSFVAKTLPSLSVNPTVQTALSGEVVDFWATMLGRGSGKLWINGILSAAGTETPQATADLRTVSPEDYRTAVALSYGALFGSRSALIQTKSPESAKQYARNLSTVLAETTNLPKNMSSEGRVRAVLKALPPAETRQALDAMEAAGVPVSTVDKFRKTVEASYNLALQKQLKEWSSTSIGSTLGPTKASLKGPTVPGSFNETTGLFEPTVSQTMNGNYVTPADKKIAGDINSLLMGATQFAKDRGYIPSGTSDIAARNMLIDGLSNSEAFNESVLKAMNEEGFVVVSPTEIIMEQKAQEEAAAKAASSTEKTTAAVKIDPPKVEKSFEERVAAVNQFAQEILKDPIRVAGSVKLQVTGGSAALNEQLKSDPTLSKVLAAIDEKEGKGDYNKLFNNSETSEFSNVKITNMTINELLEFTTPSGDYGQYVKNTRPDKEMGVSTPLGRYQIVGSTLKNLRDKLGLTGNEVFDQELQDAMFLYLYEYRKQTGQNFADEWQGLRGTDLDRKN